MLDLRHGTVVRTLIPKIAEGIFNVICKFNEGPFAYGFWCFFFSTFAMLPTILETFRALLLLLKDRFAFRR